MNLYDIKSIKMKTQNTLNKRQVGRSVRPRLFPPMGFSLVFLYLLFAASRAWVYIGPGVGFTMLWVSGAFLLVLIAAVAGLLIWPLRSFCRWQRRRFGSERNPGTDQEDKKAEGKRRVD